MLTLEQRLNRFKNLGWTYRDGVIYSHRGLAVKYSVCSINSKRKGDERVDISKGRLAWYLKTGELPTTIYHIDGDKNNTTWSNLTDSTEYKTNKGGRPKSQNILSKPKDNIYIKKEPVKAIELTYELILSLGKGKLTRKAENLLIKLVDNLSNKFFYYNEDDAKDCLSEAYYGVFKGWKSFDPEKYENAFPFMTEIAKRSFARGFAMLQGKNLNSGIIPKNVSINNFRQ